MKIIPSISYNQHDILQWIITLHTGPFDCDVTYGKGGFYRRIERPPLKFDLVPRFRDVVHADVRNLPINDAAVRNVIFDPPFMARTGPGAALKKQFGELVGTVPDLWAFYYEAMTEIRRILIPGGYLVMKCQDGVLSGKNWFTHCVVYNYAMTLGFTPVDLFILMAKHRMMHPKHQRQIHARKFHSYFWVFRK